MVDESKSHGCSAWKAIILILLLAFFQQRKECYYRRHHHNCQRTRTAVFTQPLCCRNDSTLDDEFDIQPHSLIFPSSLPPPPPPPLLLLLPCCHCYADAHEQVVGEPCPKLTFPFPCYSNYWSSDASQQHKCAAAAAQQQQHSRSSCV